MISLGGIRSNKRFPKGVSENKTHLDESFCNVGIVVGAAVEQHEWYCKQAGEAISVKFMGTPACVSH